MPEVAPAPQLPEAPLRVLTWNLNRKREALAALLHSLVDPACRWVAVLVQEWPLAAIIGEATADDAAAEADAAVPTAAGDDEALELEEEHCQEDARQEASFRSTVAHDLHTATNPPGAFKAAGWKLAALTDRTWAKGRRSVILVRTSHPQDAAWPICLLQANTTAQPDGECVSLGELCWAPIEVTDLAWKRSTRVLLVNVHATSQLTAAEGLDRISRALATDKAIQFIVSTECESKLVIAGGDWNAEPWSDELSGVALIGAARSSGELTRVVRSRTPASYFNPTWSLCQPASPAEPAGTYFFRDEATRADRWKLYDQFLLNVDAANRYLRGGQVQLVRTLSKHDHLLADGAPITKAKQGAVPISDHVPVELAIHHIHRIEDRP
jgi:hypothetical protein